MSESRREFLKLLGATTVLAGCKPADVKAQPELTPRRLMINGNMVIPFDDEGPLNEEFRSRIRSTGLAAIKQTIGGSSGSYQDTKEELNFFDKIIAENATIYAQINSVADIDRAYADQRVGIIKSFEASTPIEDDLSRIAEFAGMGVRVMQLSYNNTSSLGAGVMSVDGPLGLSERGREAIALMQENGVLLDLSHSHETTGMEAITASTRPIAATHTGCDAINLHQRNKSDGFLRALAEAGGVVGIYELSYLTPDLEQTPLSAYLAHLEHALNVCGEDHVGIGSDALLLDIDTSPESVARWEALNAERKAAGIAAPGEGPMPFVVGLNGPQRMSVIADRLSGLGMKSSVVDKVMGLNFRRVFEAAW